MSKGFTDSYPYRPTPGWVKAIDRLARLDDDYINGDGELLQCNWDPEEGNLNRDKD